MAVSKDDYVSFQAAGAVDTFTSPKPSAKLSGLEGLVTPTPARAMATPQVAPQASPAPSPGSSSHETPESVQKPFTPDDVPDIKSGKPDPQAGVVRISPTAIYHRMRRVFHPRGSSTKRVSEELVRQWDRKGKGRTSLEQIFQSCGYNPDWFAVKTTIHFYGEPSIIIIVFGKGCNNCNICQSSITISSMAINVNSRNLRSWENYFNKIASFFSRRHL